MGTTTLHVIQDETGKHKVILPDDRHFKVKAEVPGERSPIDTMPKPALAMYEESLTAGYNWAPWGEDDLLPTRIRAKIYEVPMAGQAVYKLVQMMWGNGIAYFRNRDIYDNDETTRPKRARIPVIDRWLRLNRINTSYLPAQFADYRFYMNAFSELVLTNDRTQIASVYHKPAEFCRLSVQSKRSMLSEYLLYTPKFAEGWTPQEPEIRKVPMLNMYDQSGFLQGLRGNKFAWHSRFETPGIVYYARPFWLGLFRNDGWMDVSSQVPRIVNAMMRNQIVLKYHILIPDTYFQIRYPDWQSFTHEQRESLIDDLIKKINQTLSGTDNAFASIATVFQQDHATQEPLGKIEILAVDDKIKSNAWVPSSEKADAQIVQGLGLHPSQVGLATEGGKMGAGSGSDQRESYNTGITLNTIEQEIVLETLNWIAAFNSQTDPENWDITFFIDHTTHTTTNLQESGLQPSDTTLVVEN